MSDIAKKMTGLAPVKTGAPVAQWFQTQLKEGQLRSEFARFLREQPEALDAELVVVDAVTDNAVAGHVSRVVVDHESPKPMVVDVAFTLNPLTGQFLRTL